MANQTARLKAASPPANTAEYQEASRNPMECLSSRRFLAQCVSNPADCVNEFRRASGLHFRPELSNENVHRIVFDISLIAPHGFDQPVSREHAPGIPQQQFKKFEFCRRERNRNSRPFHLMLGVI